jgi:hypothetical protein
MKTKKVSICKTDRVLYDPIVAEIDLPVSPDGEWFLLPSGQWLHPGVYRKNPVIKPSDVGFIGH